MISAIFACKIREAIISVLAEWAAPLRCSLNRADAEKELRARWSRAVAAVLMRSHKDLLKFVQEVARFVTSRFFVKKKSFWRSERALNLATKSLNGQHCVHVYYSPLSLSDCSSTRIKCTHTYMNIWTTISDWFRPRYGPNVCLLLNHRVVETFFFSNGWLHRCDLRFFLVAPLRN